MSTGTQAAVTLERGRPVTAPALSRRADWIRLQTVNLIARAGLGHYASTFSCAEVIAALYYHVLRLRPGEPDWPDRDRFLLGKGHVATGLWPVLADLGYYPEDWLGQFGKVGSPLGDHPNMRLAPGIDFSSGSLGHNLSVGVGMALSARLTERDYRTFVLTGDGELQEGQVWEAAMAASHYRLGNLVAIVDANGFSGSGPTSGAMNIEPLADRFTAFGWLATEVDGNDTVALLAAFDGLPGPGGTQPVCVIARTKKGRGATLTESAPQSWHLGLLSPSQQAEVTAEITREDAMTGTASSTSATPGMVDVFTDTEIETAVAANPAGYAVAALADSDPRILTLSADLSTPLAEFRDRHPGRYIELGIAETNSISVAAGLAACGHVPYIFSMSPFGVLKCAEQLRTDAAYTHLPLRLVGRLSGLAMGFFGTSHHAVEDIAIARAITGMTVVAPADARAVVALMRSTAGLAGPVYLRIPERAPAVYGADPEFAFGQWQRLRTGSDVTLIGHGLGTGLAVRAAAALATSGIQADVLDAAYLKPFDEAALAESAARTGLVVTVEEHSVVGGLASIVAETAGRRRLGAALRAVALPDADLEVGVPAELYEYYGLTVDGVVAAALELVNSPIAESSRPLQTRGLRDPASS